MTLAQEDTYQDVMLVCKDEIIWGVRVLLALAYPLMAEVLKEKSEQKELVVLLPDFKSLDVKSRVEEFLTSGIKKEKDREGLMEDVNFRDIFEPVVENGTLSTQEPHKADSNFTDHDGTTLVKFPEETEKVIIISFNQQEVGMFVCNEYNAEFDTHMGILLHRRSKHEGVRYECEQYDSTFTGEDTLTTHIQYIHEGVMFSCNQCNSTFTEKSNLTKHMKSKHKGVKYYVISASI